MASKQTAKKETGTAVAVVGRTMTVDTRKVNYGAAADMASKYLKKVGGGEQSTSQFPGTQIGFSSGDWSFGYGDSAKRLKPGTKFVMNLPNMMLTWNTWKTITKKDGDEVRVPHYEPVCFPAKGDDLPDREVFGTLKPEGKPDKQGYYANGWKHDKKNGTDQDPWKTVGVIPVRDDADDAVVNHIMLSNKSSVIAGLNLFGKIMAELPMHEGQLPVIAIGSMTAERGKGADKQKWQVPTFELTGWVDVIDADNPGDGGVDVGTADDGASDDVGAVKTVVKTPSSTSHATAKAEVKAEAKAKEAKGGKAKRKVEIDPSDDDEDL